VLQKFFFVGLGGSGGKTLRMLHQNLQTRLREADYPDGMPAGWQFLHVDVPVTPDGSSPDLPDQLPPSSYVGMAPKGLSYRNLDALITSRGRAAHEHSVMWRPDAHQVQVSPAYGAGQYRAVGRTITGAALGTVVESLRRSALALEDVAVDQELSRVALALSGRPEVSPHAPQVVVVTSIAGGSGAGSFLDVCDAVRQIMPLARQQIAAVLYTPEVFNELPPQSRAGVNANGLAALCELVAGYWNNEPPTEDEFAFLNAAGVQIADLERRGPSMSFLVGRANGEIAFTDQTQVYRAVARSLTAWTSDAAVQDAVHATVIGNFAQKATRQVDRTGLAPGRPAPFSSFGYASVDLGRQRFAKYAAERLARAAVDRILKGHWNERVPHEITPEMACEQEANDHLYRFLEDTGLRELGPDHNQIIDAIRGGEEQQARSAKLAALRQEITRSVVGSGSELVVKNLMQRIEARISDAWHAYLDKEYEEDKERARAWYAERQRVLAARVADLLGRIGGEASARVIELAIAELTSAVVPELNLMADTNRRVVATLPQRIHSVFANFSGQLMADNPLISKAVQEGTQSIHAEAEARLYELSARIIVDLAKNFLEPLRLEVIRTTGHLEADTAGRPGSPSIVEQWPVEAPPSDLNPAQNELLLEGVASYPDTFLQKVRETIGAPDEQGALLEAVRQVVVGQDDEDQQVAVAITRQWVPSQQVLRTMGTPVSARFSISVKASDLLDRAQEWVSRRNTALGDHIAESFEEYLSGTTATPAEHDRRIREFGAALKQALATSRPLVQIEPAANAHFHQVDGSAIGSNQIITPMPFPKGHPARAVVASVLHDRSENELERLFEDSNRQRVDITTFLDAPAQPVVFQSLVGPMAGEWAQRRSQPNLGGFWQWRRARPLPEFVPVAPDVRRAMIRGWFIARMLNHLDIEDPRSRPITLALDDGTKAPFPFPLLGPPIAKLDDLLPAVLESMAIALVAQPQQALRPYHRLHDLGAAKDASPGSGIPLVLERWIGEGHVVSGAHAPKETEGGTAAGTRGERADALLQFLRTYLGYYQQITDLDATAHDVQLPRVWEIGREIVGELAELQNLVINARQAIDFTHGIG
jgi:hypothetical protein